jgi:hypothetical protein
LEVSIKAMPGDSLFKSQFTGDITSAITRPASSAYSMAFSVKSGDIYFMKSGVHGNWIKMKVHFLKFVTDENNYPGWKIAKVLTEQYLYRNSNPDFSVH